MAEKEKIRIKIETEDPKSWIWEEERVLEGEMELEELLNCLAELGFEEK